MYRWGQIAVALDIKQTAMNIYRPDLYRQAARQVGISCPQQDAKVEGCHAENWMLDGIEMGQDLFFDGSTFDSSHVVDYIRQFTINRLKVDFNGLVAMNSRQDAQ